LVTRTEEDFYRTETKSFNGLCYNPRNNVLVIFTNNTINDTSIFSDMAITFSDLFSKWKQETSFISSSKMFDNLNYQKIIALGEKVLPELINKLDGSSTLLFFALYKITGKNPVKPENYGNISEMTKDWKNWWEENKENYA
jgi:hypothetical protein